MARSRDFRGAAVGVPDMTGIEFSPRCRRGTPSAASRLPPRTRALVRRRCAKSSGRFGGECSVLFHAGGPPVFRTAGWPALPLRVRRRRVHQGIRPEKSATSRRVITSPPPGPRAFAVRDRCVPRPGRSRLRGVTLPHARACPMPAMREERTGRFVTVRTSGSVRRPAGLWSMAGRALARICRTTGARDAEQLIPPIPRNRSHHVGRAVFLSGKTVPPARASTEQDRWCDVGHMRVTLLARRYFCGEHGGRVGVARRELACSRVCLLLFRRGQGMGHIHSGTYENGE